MSARVCPHLTLTVCFRWGWVRYSAQRGVRLKVQCEVWDEQPVTGDSLLSVGRVDVSEVRGVVLELEGAF